MLPEIKLWPMGEQYQAIGKPNYSDVSGRGFCWPTYDEAKAEGERILRAGNWSYFEIHKTFVLAPPGSPIVGVEGGGADG